MSFKSGGDHHLVKSVTDAKVSVLAYVAAGTSVHAAMVAAGKKPDTVRQWLVTLRNDILILGDCAAEWQAERLQAIG